MTELLASLPAVSFRFIDIVIFILLVLGAYRGYHKGFIVELISSFSFVIALLLTFKLVQLGFDLSRVHLGVFSKAGPFFSFMLTFFLLTFGINYLGRRLKDTLEYTIFDSFDAFIGLILSLFKYCFGIGVFLKLLTYVGLITTKSDIHTSIFYP